jgi:hypothetical protein
MISLAVHVLTEWRSTSIRGDKTMRRTCVLVLAMFGLLIGTAYGDKPKGYSVKLTEGRIGDSDFDRGDYKLLVHRDKMTVEIMDLKTGDIFDIIGKVETADSKFERTEILANTADGVKRIAEIRIGGTAFRIDFRAIPLSK